MNRRHLLIALAVALPIAVFIPAKIAASWRPVAVGSMKADFTTSIAYSQPYVAATPREVCMHMMRFNPAIFDLKSGQSRPFYGAVTRERDARWEIIVEGKANLLKLYFPDLTQVFKIPKETHVITTRTGRADIQVSSNAQSVQMLAGLWFCRWDRKSGKLQKEFRVLKGDYNHGYGEVTLSGDAEYVVSANKSRISFISTRDEQLSQRFPLTQFKSYYTIPQQSSLFGTYTSYWESLPHSISQGRFTMIDTTNGRSLHKFDWNTNDVTVFSPDETLFAIGRVGTEAQWEIRDLRTGQLVRTLPLVPQTKAAAFSPDNGTLYSIKGNRLYRQRAR